jgi:hypothetical protein
MPGAQPRRAFESRIGSTARRGAYAPAGVPGVYRVPRSRTVTVTSDPGRPAVGAPVWVQPEDVETSITVGSLMQTRNGTPATGETDALLGASAPVETKFSAFDGGDDIVWWTCIIQLSPNNLSADPVSPSPPPGMSVEYEATEGLLLEATIDDFELIVSSSFPALDPLFFRVEQMALADILPGRPVMPFMLENGPSHTTSGTPVYTNSGQGTFPVGPFTQSFPDPEQHVAWRIGLNHALDETNPLADGSAFLFVQGSTGTPAIPVTYTYRPPRYRFV